MGPIRRAVGTALFPAFQFGQFAADLHGQDGDTPQAPPQVVYPVRALTQHMVHDDPCPDVRGFGRGRVQDGGQGQARGGHALQQGSRTAGTGPQKIVHGQDDAVAAVVGQQLFLQGAGQGALARTGGAVEQDHLPGRTVGGRSGRGRFYILVLLSGGIGQTAPVKMHIARPHIAVMHAFGAGARTVCDIIEGRIRPMKLDVRPVELVAPAGLQRQARARLP